MDDITIRIGNETKNFADATENWVTEQINRRRADLQSICVEVVIHTSGLNLRLTTPGCGGSGGGCGRPPSTNEKAIFGLWDERGLNSRDFTGGALVAFLKQLRKLTG